MDQTFTCVLLLLSLSATFGKYVYIDKTESWHDAQDYCRQFYTDLAPVSNNHDIQQLRQFVSDLSEYIWIGLERNFTDSEKWTWSGGGGVSTFFWALGQPQNRPNEDYGLMRNFAWYDATPNFYKAFFCYRVVVVRKRKTWDEALEYCREHHRDLASVASDTEMLLIQKELNKYNTTDHVWIGLHFFPGHWLWVDGQPLNYEAWGQEGKPACPEVKQCAALQMMRGTSSNNGTESTLVTNATVRTGAVHTGSYVNIAAHSGLDISGESDAAACVRENVWEALVCEERLHFICY